MKDPRANMIGFAGGLVFAAALAIISTAAGGTIAFGLWYGVYPLFWH